MSLRLVVLISGAGSNMADLLRRVRENPHAGLEVVAVGADREAPGLDSAAKGDVETFVVTFPGSDRRAEWGEKLADTLESYSPDLVVLSGLMRLLPPETVQRFQGRLINTHPSYLPDFPGAHAVRDQVEAGVSDAGASIIVVDNGVDTGPIIEQQRVAVMPHDSEASLHARIKQVERELLWRVLTELAGGQRTLPVGQD